MKAKHVNVWLIQNGQRSEIHLAGAAMNLDQATQLLPAGAYTTFRTFDQWNVLHLEDHLNRLVETACLTGQDIRIDKDVVRNQLRSVLHELNFPDSRCRLILDTTSNPGDVYLAVERLVLPATELYEQGVKVISRQMQRDNPRAKQTTFIDLSAKTRSALPDGVFEVLMTTQRGEILEGTTSNFFAICNNTLRTAEEGVLPGITRSIILEEAQAAGLHVDHTPITRDELAACSEAFLTSSSRGVLPIRQIDDQVIGNGQPGWLTITLRTRYEERIRREAQTV